MSELLQIVTNGLIVGAIIALGAIGLSVIYGLLDFANLAHGDFMTFGAYAAFVVNVSIGLGLIPSIVLSMAAGAVLAVLVDLVVLRPMRRRNAGGIALLIVSLGIGLVLRNVMGLIWGPATRLLDVDVYSTNAIGPIRISSTQIAVLIVSVTTLTALGYALKATRAGRVMRAVSQSPDIALVSGVNIHAVRRASWILGIALAALAGTLLAVLQGAFDLNMGLAFLFPIFAATILGGIGNPYGTLIASLALGVVMEVSTFDGLLGGLDAVYKPVVAFVVLVLALTFRPQGVFGKARLL